MKSRAVDPIEGDYEIMEANPEVRVRLAAPEPIDDDLEGETDDFRPASVLWYLLLPVLFVVFALAAGDAFGKATEEGSPPGAVWSFQFTGGYVCESLDVARTGIKEDLISRDVCWPVTSDGFYVLLEVAGFYQDKVILKVTPVDEMGRWHLRVTEGFTFFDRSSSQWINLKASGIEQ